MASTYRYPFPPYPDGWYLLVESAALGTGDVLALHYFGRDLVLFRTESDRAVLVDAHCPHMGAHLGYGGTIDGEGIRCPFHHWCFDAEGHCVDVPYARLRSRPPKVSLRTWPVREHSGLIMAWCSESGQPPTWEPPIRTEFGSAGWIGYETTGWTIRMHTQELAENIPDMAHFTYVHEVGPQLRAEYETDGHVYRQRSLAVIDGVPIEFTTQEANGLGCLVAHEIRPRHLVPHRDDAHRRGVRGTAIALSCGGRERRRLAERTRQGDGRSDGREHLARCADLGAQGLCRTGTARPR